jgi:hypothetical protein
MLLTKADDNVIHFPDGTSDTLLCIVTAFRTGKFHRAAGGELSIGPLTFCEKYDLPGIGGMVILADAKVVASSGYTDALIWASRFKSDSAATALMRRGAWNQKHLTLALDCLTGKDAARLPSTWVYALGQAGRVTTLHHTEVQPWRFVAIWYTFSGAFCDYLLEGG